MNVLNTKDLKKKGVEKKSCEICVLQVMWPDQVVRLLFQDPIELSK